MARRSWFPEVLTGDGVVLRRHAPANLRAFQRWYSDPDVVRLTRYQDGPMRPAEIERFFAARALGSDSLAMAIHRRADDRLIGTCALSQLDADNGSALFHITIGEKDAWGQGHGTEATRLMVDHAFTGLGLHRIGLTVFSFNERAIRSYRSVGFVVEGRAREAIWREGRWWDEIAMSILDSDWTALRPADGISPAAGVTPPTGSVSPPTAGVVGPGSRPAEGPSGETEAARPGGVMAGIFGRKR